MYQNMALGVVVACYPAGQSVDVLLADDGSRLSNVQVMVPTGSSDTGYIDLPDIGGSLDDSRWDIKMTPERYVRAVVGFLSGVPVVIGFLLPQITQMTFDQKNRHVMRHASDVYSTIDGAGNAEFYHPSGAYIRFGTSPAHEDLTGKDVDRKWKIAHNTESQVHIHIEQAGGAASIDIAPDGAITVNTNSTITATAEGAVLVKAPSVTLDTPETTCTGNLTVAGAMNVQGQGASGAVSTFAGSIKINGGDVEADDISLKGHGHIEQGDGNRTSNAVS